MFSGPLLLCFALWLATGVGLARRASRQQSGIAVRSRAWRVGVGVGLFVGGLAVLGGGLAGVASLGGFPKEGTAPWAWVVVGLIGALFVASQTFGMAILATLAFPQRVTSDRVEASTPQEPPR